MRLSAVKSHHWVSAASTAWAAEVGTTRVVLPYDNTLFFTIDPDNLLYSEMSIIVLKEYPLSIEYCDLKYFFHFCLNWDII